MDLRLGAVVHEPMFTSDALPRERTPGQYTRYVQPHDRGIE